MPNYGELLLNKVVEQNDIAALKRYRVDRDHFATDAERDAYQYVLDYSAANRGQAPSYAVFVDETRIEYIPSVSDSYEWLTQRLKEHAAKRMWAESGAELERVFNEGSADEIESWFADKVSEIKRKVNTQTEPGVSVKKSGEGYLAELKSRREGKSFKVWRSSFPTINDEIGGYLSGNMYTWYGRSGRGKSVFTLVEALEAAMQGARVLIWSLEMSRFEVLSRLVSMLSARYGAKHKRIDGVDYETGFENKALLMGGIDDEILDELEQFWARIDELVPGEINIRAVDDEDFYQRGVKQLEADILALQADVVVVDPFYYLDYERNTSKTAGGDAAATSKKIRHIAGYTKAVIHVITQADEVKDAENEDGGRELRPAKRAEIKKTKAVLEDAVNTFGIDSVDGLAAIELGKGRNGGEGTLVDVIYLPNYGVIKEAQIDASQFKF